MAYLATNGRVKLRVLAYRPELDPMPKDHLRIVVQAVEHGQPIAEDPICIESMATLDFARWLHNSRNDGWDLRQWGKG